MRRYVVIVMLVAIILALVAVLTFRGAPERVGPPPIRLYDGIDGEWTKYEADTIFIDLMRENKSKLRIAWVPTAGGVYQIQAVVVIPESATDSTADSTLTDSTLGDSAQ